MVKIQNLSSGPISLKFRNAAGTYFKTLRGNSVMTLDSREYKELLPPEQTILALIKITRYNIHGAHESKVEIYNPTKDRIIIEFVKSPQDKYQKVLGKNGMLTVDEDEFAIIQNLDSRLETLKVGASRKAFVAAVENVAKTAPQEIIPDMGETVEVEDEPARPVFMNNKNKKRN